MNKKSFKEEWVWITQDSNERMLLLLAWLLCDEGIRHALIVNAMQGRIPVIRY